MNSTVNCIDVSRCCFDRKDTIEHQKSYIVRLRSDLKDPETFRKIYNFTFDYAKTEGQKSMSKYLQLAFCGRPLTTSLRA